MLVLHHVTYSINSLCHYFGRSALPDGRRVAQPALARRSPRSARRGTTTITPSPPPPATGCASGTSIPRPWSSVGLERLGLVWDVVRVTPERQALKASPARLSRSRVTEPFARGARGRPSRPALQPRALGRHPGPATRPRRVSPSTVRSPDAVAHMLRAPGPARRRARIRVRRARARRPRRRDRPARLLEAAIARRRPIGRGSRWPPCAPAA